MFTTTDLDVLVLKTLTKGEKTPEQLNQILFKKYLEHLGIYCVSQSIDRLRKQGLIMVCFGYTLGITSNGQEYLKRGELPVVSEDERQREKWTDMLLEDSNYQHPLF